MLAHEERIAVEQPIAAVWCFVVDMENWAAIMPGFRDYELIDGNESRWTLKVGVGSLVKTVQVLVSVNCWSEPDNVSFTYRLEREAVHGDGRYSARATGDGATEVGLHIRILGSGPMAPAWEAMARPLLPRLCRGFAEGLKISIEAQGGADQSRTLEAPPSSRSPTWWRRLLARFMRLLTTAAS